MLSSRIQTLSSYIKKQAEEVPSGLLSVEQKKKIWGEKHIDFEYYVLFP